MISLLDRILTSGALTTVMQPIVSSTDGELQVHAYECLTRGPAGTSAENTDVMFDYVRLKNQEPIVDRACIATAFAAAAYSAIEVPISVNVHAVTLARDASFPKFLVDAAADAGLDPASVILEICEHSWTGDGEVLFRAVRRIREAGIRIALDDIGLGYANHQMILEVRPDYFKIDKYFIHGCDDDRGRVAVISSILQLAADFGGVTVAEGVEKEGEWERLAEAGVTLFQGFFFGRPVLPRALGIEGLEWEREFRSASGCQ